MSTTHTPDWTHREGYCPHHQGHVHDATTGRDIAVTYNDEGGRNARLISAAPDLLSALQPLLDYCRSELRHCKSILIDDHSITMHEALLQAHAAIQKATV